ncbi:MAG: hypothetical protein NVS3B20_02720 [Polyangiales bacterium]
MSEFTRSATAEDAAALLETTLQHPERPLTIADAATQSGLPLRDAERGLHALVATYRGHLRVDASGDLLFLFPTRFTKPWERADAMRDLAKKLARGAVGLGRFIVRAWLSVVLFGYVAIFLGVLIGLSLARSNDSSSNRGGGGAGGLIYVLLRVLGDALFWTFHPFSPIASRAQGNFPGRSAARFGAAQSARTPFYEKVNRFFFGPVVAPPDPREAERALLTVIRQNKGRIGLADVMRVTGLPRDQADPMMARLMVDYDGDVDVSTEGGIVYRFEALRKTAEDATERQPKAAWDRAQSLPPFTGNGAGSNVLIGALNGFNLLMSIYALDAHLNLDKLSHLFDRIPSKIPLDESTAVALGVIPLIFSTLIFLIPIGRAIARPILARRMARERGRLALLREVLTRIETKAPVPAQELSVAYRVASGIAVSERDVQKEIIALGGDAEIDPQGAMRYRFIDLETEAAALEEEREAAPDAEKRVGPIVFSSDE